MKLRGLSLRMKTPPLLISRDPDHQSSGDEGKSRRSFSWPLLIIISLSALLLIAATSAVGGYFSGINQRTNFEVTQVALQVEEQYQLGLEDMQAETIRARSPAL